MRSIHLGAATAAACLTLLAASAAQAVPMASGGFPSHIVPPRAGLLAAHGLASAAQAHGSALDTTPPVLTGFAAGTSVDAAQAFAQLPLSVKASDDLSGVNAVYVYAQGPSGQWIGAGYYAGYQARKVSGSTAFNLNINYQPGTWSVQEVDVYDNAGNVTSYFASDLAAMGNTTFTVSNHLAWSLDTAPPAVSAATVLTPSVSLSGHAKGTNGSPQAAVQMSVSDTGTPRLSGVQFAMVYFCKADFSNCFEIYMQDGLAGDGNVSFKAYASLYTYYLTPGDYIAYYVYSYDWQGNTQFLVNQALGGETDFTPLMPAGQVITLTP